MKTYIDLETGEFQDGYLLTEEQIQKNDAAIERKKKYLSAKKDYSLFQDVAGGFTFMLVDTLKELHADERFTEVDKARLIFLGTFVSYENKGSYLMTNNNKYLQKSALQNLLEIRNKKDFYKFYNKLKAAGIIKEEHKERSDIRLQWNSKYHFKGRITSTGVSSTEAVKAYDRQIQALYKEKNQNGKSVNTPKNLYLLFMVLPFLNVSSGCLCRQPLITIDADSEPLEVSDVAKMFHYAKPSTFKNKLLNCKLFGTNVFVIAEGTTAERKKYTRIYVNPFVSSRTPKTPNPSLLAMFPGTEKVLATRLIKQQKVNDSYAKTRKERKNEEQ